MPHFNKNSVHQVRFGNIQLGNDLLQPQKIPHRIDQDQTVGGIVGGNVYAFAVNHGFQQIH